MATYGFKEGKNTSGVYTKTEVDGMFDGVVEQCVTAITPTLTSMQGQIDTTVTNVNAALSAQDGEISTFETSVNAALNLKQSKQKTATVTLAPGSWTYDSGAAAYKQTVSVSGLLATDTVIVAPAPGSSVNYATYACYCVSQSNGSLTFTAMPQPSISLSVNVLALEV